MYVWHLSPDTLRAPRRVAPGDRVSLRIGTWPVGPDQSVWVTHRVRGASGAIREGRVEARWHSNEAERSYWRAEIGPFARGERVEYAIAAASPSGRVEGGSFSFKVGPVLQLALLWHQHQPTYRVPGHAPVGSYRHPWVRLHAVRDYYRMAAMVETHPALRLTINLTPVLLLQLDDYLEHGATDHALELTRKPPESLDEADREEMLDTFFDADAQNQIAVHPRYQELSEKRLRGAAFSNADFRDLAMWASLAWFPKEMREGAVSLPGGQVVSVRHLVDKGAGFSGSEIEEMIGAQYAVMGAVVPIHRALADAGRIEVSTTPFYHPILPLLIDTDQATIDRPGTTKPPRFAHPEDADAQTGRAVACYRQHFGRDPVGMWPAEGAVSQAVVPIFARHGVRWIASDQGVLARSGRYGFAIEDPDVSCRPYRAREGSDEVAIFFRNAHLADAIGFRYQGQRDYGEAAFGFIREVKEMFAKRLYSDEDRVLTVALDGENAWGAYRNEGSELLHALYRALEQDPEIRHRDVRRVARRRRGTEGAAPSDRGHARGPSSLHRLVDRRARLGPGRRPRHVDRRGGGERGVAAPG